VQLTPNGHPDKPSWLNNLGGSLLVRYEDLEDISDVENSISLLEDAMRLTSGDQPDKPVILQDRDTSLSRRFEKLGELSDIEKSISIGGDAVRLTSDGHPEKPSRFSTLGLSLSSRFLRLVDLSDINDAIPMVEDAVRLIPDGHSSKPSMLINLAILLFTRFQRDGSSDPSSSDLRNTTLHSSRAARSSSGQSADRFRASQLWIQYARHLQHDPQSILDAYTVAIDLLPQLAWMGLPLNYRHHELLKAADIVRDAAATGLDACRPDTAVEWLEQGRSVVWNQLSQLRTPVDKLRASYPELADQLERVSHQLEHASAREKPAMNKLMNDWNTEDTSLEVQAREHHAVALLWEKLLVQIRSLPGFERFLLPKTIEQLTYLVHSGPVVFLNCNRG
jgi:hypothetical protein